MRMDKKKLAVVSLVLCVAAIVSMSSLAWFTADDTLVNNLSFVTDFQMDLVEHNSSNQEVGTGSSSTGLTFENIRPNMVLRKDPTVRNKSSAEGQWIRATITLDKYSAWAEVEDINLPLMFDINSNLWEAATTNPVIDTTEDTVSYTYYLKSKLAAGKDAILFTTVHIPAAVTLEQATALTGATITVKAEAIQASDLGPGVSTCKAAFALIKGN